MTAPVTDLASGLPPATVEDRPRPRRRGLVSDTSFAYRMLAPALLVVGGVLLFPLAYSLWTSLNKVSTADLSMQFAGLDNYRRMFANPLFVTSLLNTLYFAVLTIVGTVGLGLLIALVLNERFVGRRALRTVVIIPWAISQVLVGIVWSWMFNGSFGVVNAGLQGAGVIDSYHGWLSDPSVSMLVVAIAYIWSSVPFAVLMYLTALQRIPAELYKAARIDGADALRSFRYVTMPALRYTTLVVLVVASLEGLLAFSLIYVMTGGGPGTTTSVLAWLGYQTTFVSLDLGVGAAIFYFLVVVLMVVTGAYIRLLRAPGREPGR